MPRFAANLTLLFTEVPMLDRPDWARRTGFDGVEVLFPYDHPVADWERALAGLPLALINTPPGDWASGDRGFAARRGTRPPSATVSCARPIMPRGWVRGGCM